MQNYIAKYKELSLFKKIVIGYGLIIIGILVSVLIYYFINHLQNAIINSSIIGLAILHCAVLTETIMFFLYNE